MKAKTEERRKAREMRRQGAPITEIAAVLGVAKSSVYTWTVDIVLTRAQRDALRTRDRTRGTQAMQAKNSEARRLAWLAGYGWAQEHLTPRVAYAVAWWEAEGAKHRNALNFTNCDPDAIQTFLFLLDAIGVPAKQIHFRLMLHEGNSDEAAKEYWKEQASIPVQFEKTSYKPRGKRAAKWPNGICRVEVTGGGQTKWHSFLDGVASFIRGGVAKR